MKHEQFSVGSRSGRADRTPDAVVMRQKSDHEAQIIVTSIKQMIAEARIAVGDRLPPEVDLCKRYSTTRHTLRKAMTMLEKEGLVARFVGRGSFIVGPSVQSSPGKDPSQHEQRWGLHELTEARMIFEPHLVALIIERYVPRDLAELDRCVEALSKSDNWATFGEAKYSFHLALVKTAKNAFLTYIFEQIVESRRKIGWSRHDPSGVVMDRVKEITILECRSILTALRKKDAATAQREIENSILRVLMWISGT